MDRRARPSFATGARLRGPLALVAAAGLVFGVACSAEQGRTPGQLTIALRTNMTPGADFDALRLVVKRGDEVLQDLPYDWPRGAGEPPMRFPATYAIVNRTSGSPSLTVRFEAKQGGRLRIVREAKTVLPTSGDFLLPVLLDWLCLDRIPVASPVDVQCNENETCIAGVCTTPEVQGSTLAPYSAGAVFGGATSASTAPSSGSCFDVLGTFDGATTYAPEALSGPCGIAWSGGEANLNAAVALPAASAGFCYAGNPGGCLVPLEKGGASGWSLANGRLVVPAAVCASSGPTAGGKLAIVKGKPTKAENQPPCGSFSSVGAPDAGTAPMATIVVTDADAGARDAGGEDATVDAGAADAAAPDAAAPDAAAADAASDGGGLDARAPDAGDPCAGVTCNAPPPSTCVNTTTRRFFSQGVCAAGTCSYASTDQACASRQRCESGVCVCVPESDAELCARLGATCGAKSGTDNCGAARTAVSCGSCSSGSSCSANVCVSNELRATTASLVGDGLNNCGASSNDVCARSLAVAGGTFYRGTDTANPATIAGFRLDKYEVTVGRFRKFVDAWIGGWRPSVGSGKHAHLNGGAGLANTAGGNEPGWDASWTAYVGAASSDAVTPAGPGASTKAAWDAMLSCSSGYQTWTSAAGANEKRPQNCLSWYDFHAFCIWDGGFLTSEAEWEYVAAGGGEERAYPWGATAPGSNASLAVYGCLLNGSGTCSGSANIALVGSATSGASKWGHLDLAGNIWEWVLDGYAASYSSPCANCTNLPFGTNRVVRGGSFFGNASFLASARRDIQFPASRDNRFGGRCARAP